MPHCPDCHAAEMIKNGSLHTGKQNDAGNAWGILRILMRQNASTVYMRLPGLQGLAHRCVF
jgi:hypothetical protein